jgi:hypothetical protein
VTPWRTDDTRWEDEASTVPYGPPPMAAVPRPSSRPGRTHRARLLASVVVVAIAGAGVFMTGAGSASREPPPAHRYDQRTATLEVGGMRYALGEAGDVLLVGDWDCDGTPTPALYRPADGRIFRFSSWPDGRSMASAPAEVAEAGGHPAVERVDGCDRIVVHVSGDARGRDKGRPTLLRRGHAGSPRGRDVVR